MKPGTSPVLKYLSLNLSLDFLSEISGMLSTLDNATVLLKSRSEARAGS